MPIADLLARSGGLQSIARELGVDESQAASGAEALLPAIVGGLRKQSESGSTGMDALGGLLGRLGGGSLLDEVVSSQSGLDPSLLRRMLPMLAMLVAGYLSKQGGASAGSASTTSTGDAGLPGTLGGLGGLASMFDADGNGNPLDDILRSMRK